MKTMPCPGSELSKAFRKAVTFVMQLYLICIGRVHVVDLSFACIATLAAKTRTIYSTEIQKVRKLHYSKGQFFVQKPRHFTSFSPKNFLTIFLVKSKLSRAKQSKTTSFSRVFHPEKIDNFLGKSKLNFWTQKMKISKSVKIAFIKSQNLKTCFSSSYHS